MQGGTVDLCGPLRKLKMADAAAIPRVERSPQFAHARSCYGHFAGEVAVELLDAMLRAQWLIRDGRDFVVSGLGTAKLAAMGLDLAAVRRPGRVFARACIDLTQRRPHVSGTLGKGLLELYVARGWVERQRDSRVILVTAEGEEYFTRLFGGL